MRLHRMISIMLIIENKGKIKAKDLADELETSVRTIYRDIDALCEAGIPLTAETGPNGGIHFIDGYKVGINDINEDDVINLYLSSMGIKADKESDISYKVKNSLLKLQKNATDKLSNNLNTVERKFFVDDIPWWGEKRHLKYIDEIVDAVWQSMKLDIIYEKANGDVSQRIVRPYGIVVNEMNWYLIAFCEKSSEMRTFKCERISQCEKTADNFIVPVNFDVKEYWQKSKNSFIKRCNEREKYYVTLRINQDDFYKLKDYKVIDRTDHENYLEVTINMYRYDMAQDSIMNIINYAEVIKPVQLRKYVKEQLQRLIEKY